MADLRGAVVPGKGDTPRLSGRLDIRIAWDDSTELTRGGETFVGRGS